jgi:signal transduction histidine kinase/DNA-binding response OmpR family regulator
MWGRDRLLERSFALMVLLATVATALLLYWGYGSYRNMQTASRLLERTEALDSVARLVGNTQEEMLQSARYYGLRGVNYLEQLERARTKTDQAFRSARDTVSDGAVRSALEHFSDRLRTWRIQIDELDPKNSRLFTELNVSDPTVVLMQPSLFSSPKRHDKLDANRALIHTRVALINQELGWLRERTFLSYAVARKSPLDPGELAAWEGLLEAWKPLDPSTVSSRVLADRLRDILLPMLENRGVLSVRRDVLEHMKQGDYTIRLNEIENNFHAPKQTLERAQSLVHKTIVDATQEIRASSRYRLTAYGILIALLWGIVLLLWRYVHTRGREKRILEESLKEITSELDEEHRVELEHIIRKNDRSALYRFLARITLEARAAEERALQAEKAKDLFLANMSHEIRTPLNGILGFSQLLEGTTLDAEQKEFLGVIQSSSNNLLNIVNDILDLSKIRAQKIDLEQIPFDLVAQIEEAVEPHAAKALEKGVEYSAFIDPTVPKVLGDPTKMTQVVTNLIGNAVKFTAEGGSVDVEMRKVKEDQHNVVVRFSVRDTGIGISPDQQSKIFEPFAQADVSTTRQFGGTGLGLTITRDIIGQMGGTLHLKSEVGEGSEFYFELAFPRVEEENEAGRRPLAGKQIAYYHPGTKTLRQMERNLATYMRSTGAQYRLIGDHDLDLLDDVDLLLLNIVDEKTRAQFDTFAQLGKPIVSIATVTQRQEGDPLLDRSDRVVYRPLTASKLVRACLEAMGTDRVPAEEIGADIDESRLRGMRILVAEDNPINQKLIERILNNLRIESVMVANGKEALDKRKEGEHFDAVLMDIQMPVMGGIDATKAILEYERTAGVAHVPIIALTANALQGDREKYLDAGMDDYLSKPINIDQLKMILLSHSGSPEEAREVASVVSSREEEPSRQPIETILMYIGSDRMLIERIHRSTLEARGYKMEVVRTPEEVVDAVNERTFAYVLLDHCRAHPIDCEIVEMLEDKGVEYRIHASELETYPCSVGRQNIYTSVADFLKTLM